MAEKLLSPSNGLSNSKLSQATATEEDVLTGKTFYSGDKNIKTGTLNLSSTVSIVSFGQPPIGNEYRNGSSSYNTGKTILWCPIQEFRIYNNDANNRIVITSYSGSTIYYNWWVHNNGIQVYVPIIFA